MTENGKITKKGELTDLTLPAFRYDGNKDVRLNISVRLKNGTSWADAGHEICNEQFVLNDRITTAFKAKPLKTGRQADMEEAKKWFDMVSQHFFRAPTDNDKGFGNWIAKDWKNNRLDSPAVSVVKPLEAVRNADGTVTVTASTLCKYSNGSIRTDYIYTMDSEGSVDFKATYTPESSLPPLPCMGNTFVLPKNMQNISWYGMGLQDTYPDRLEAYGAALSTNSMYIMPARKIPATMSKWQKLPSPMRKAAVGASRQKVTRRLLSLPCPIQSHSLPPQHTTATS